MSEKRFFVKVYSNNEPFFFDEKQEYVEKRYTCEDVRNLHPMEYWQVVELLNEQQATIFSLEDENLYRNFELKSVDDLKRLKDIFEICMILIDGAIADEDLELGYESVFQFERRIKKFKGD